MRILLSIVSLLWLGSTAFSQHPAVDAQSRVLLAKADAVLAGAKSISFEESLSLGPQVGGEEWPPGAESCALVSASRPDCFRVETSGEQARLFVSDGVDWVKAEVGGTACRVADVSTLTIDGMFPADTPDRVERGHGVLGLFLGKHSLGEWLADGDGVCEYAGVEVVDGMELHRLNGTAQGSRVSLFLSVSEPVLPVLFVREVPLVEAGAGKNPHVPERTYRFRVLFSNWDLGVHLPESTFRFVGSDRVEREGWRSFSKDIALPPAEGAGRPFVEALARSGTARTNVVPAAFPVGKAFPDGAAVYTSASYRTQIQRAVATYFAGLYQANSECRSPVWDGEVEDMCALWGEFVANRDVILRERLRRKAVHVMDMGCRDPLVLLCATTGVRSGPGNTQRTSQAAMAWDALCSSSYPASCRLIVLTCVPGLIGDLVAQKPLFREQFQKQAPDLFVQAANESGLVNGDLRVLSYLLDGSWNAMALEGRKEVLERLVGMPDVDPWLPAYYGGSLLASLAPKVKEELTQSSTPENAERMYQDCLQTAKQQLELATKLRPDFPEGPTQAIAICTPEEARANFDLAIAAQIDWAPAYTALRRCYADCEGGNTWIYELGIEAARTQRFDSDAPCQVWESYCELHRLGESWQEIMSRPDSLEMLRSVCDGYLAQSNTQPSPRFWLTVWLIGCWGSGQGEEAVGILRKLDMQPDVSVCRRAGVDPLMLVAEVLLSAGPYARTGRQGLNLLAAGRASKGVPLIRRAMVGLWKSDPKVAAYLGGRICQVRLVDCPELAGVLVDTMIDMQSRERLIGAFASWMAQDREAIPPDLEKRVADYLGPICWALLPYAPGTGQLTDEEIEHRLAQLDSLNLDSIPGLDHPPEEDVRNLFATELALARMRLHYYHQSDEVGEAWGYCTDHVAPSMASVIHYGLLLDFISDHQDRRYYDHARTIRYAMASLLCTSGPPRWNETPDQLGSELVELRGMPDRLAMQGSLWDLYRLRGTPRSVIRMKNAMDETGMRPDASLLEYHLLYYIRGLISPSDDPFTGSVAAEILNSTPGYENLVVASGELLHLWLRRAASVSDEADEVLDPGRMQFPSSLLTRVYVCQADAHLRLGDLDAAISALVESRRIRANTDEWFFALGERFQGSDSCAAAIVQAISRHPNATEETQSLLDEIFPEFRQ